MRTEKEELIIKLRIEGKTWDQIAHKAQVSHTTIKNTLAEYEQSQAFELFDKGYLPTQVKTLLGISPENTEKHFLAHLRLTDLVDLGGTCKELGQHLPDFLDFYKSARSHNITPYNMNSTLNLAKNIENLKEQASQAQVYLQQTNNFKAQEVANLTEIQRQSKIADNLLTAAKSELQFVKSVLDSIKNSGDHQDIRDTIFEAVNSLSSERYVLLAALVTVMKKIQKDPTIIPLLQFPFPQDLDMTAHTYYHNYTLTRIINEAAKLMPEVGEEMTGILTNGILAYIQSHSNSNVSDRTFQVGAETSPVLFPKTDSPVRPQDPVEVDKPIPTKQRSTEKAKQGSIVLDLLTVLAFYQHVFYDPLEAWR